MRFSTFVAELDASSMRILYRPSLSDSESMTFSKRGSMLISRLYATLALGVAVSTALAPNALAQNALIHSATAGVADDAKQPKLERFDPNLADKTLDPCNDFYKYSCSKWLTANPIPADQVFWSTGSGLEIWNEGVLRDTMEAASKSTSNRTAVQQKIGDYWAA
jgi:endothelin-converting enzyme/putative endopeptidase